VANDEALWARQLARAGILGAARTIANPQGFPGGGPGGGADSPGDQRYFNETQPPQPQWMTEDPGQAPGGPPQPTPSLQIHPPWEYPPQGAQLFGVLADTVNAPGAVELPAGAGSQITIPGVSYLTPNMMFSVVRLVTIYVLNATSAFNATYYLRNNGQSLYPGGFRLSPGTANLITFPYGVTIRDIPPGTIDILIVNNGAGGPWNVGAGFNGWSYTQAQALALTGGLAS
jgi:hypothetical protein